jgi:hypothetical protein
MDKIHQLFFGIMLTGILLLFCFGIRGLPVVQAEEEAPPATPEPTGPYFTSTDQVLGDGTKITRISIFGPPDPPAGYERDSVSLPDTSREMSSVVLTVPAFWWSLGCSATSASMIAAYWDRNGFANIYTGPTDGGVMPLKSSSWGTFTDSSGHSYGQCPLTASRDGLDGRSGRGSIDDYWVAYLSTAVDPFIWRCHRRLHEDQPVHLR